MNKKKGIVIGLGGMGLRHIKSLISLKIEVIAICDKDPKKIQKVSLPGAIKTTNFKKLLNLKADIVCIASNTQSREFILKNFLLFSDIEKILIEKPLAISFNKCLILKKLINKEKKKKVIVNTFRTLSPNFKKIKKIFTTKGEKISLISINSPSAGLGNMGSIFFDLSNYFINSDPKFVNCFIDKKGTINPRGAQFKDPGGYGVVRYKNNEKVFFDLSENTSIPYKIILKSKNIELTIDEINKIYKLEERPKIFKSKPEYFYLYKPDHKILKSMNKYDVVEMTKYSIRSLFKKKFKSNIDQSIKAMQIVFACHASKVFQKTIKIPLLKKFHNIRVKFP